METTDILENYPTISKPDSGYINQAVYNLLTAYLHNYHFNSIANAKDNGHMALSFLQNHCAKISHEDATRYRSAFSSNKQFHNESMIRFLKGWHAAKKLAIDVGNKYTAGEIIDML